MLPKVSSIIDPSDPEYIFQGIRDGIYSHEPVTAELIAVVAHFLAARHQVKLTLEDTPGIIVRLKKLQPKVKFAKIAMTRLPNGFYSANIEEFFGRLCGLGYAESDGRGIQLQDKGLKIFQEIVGEFFSQEPLVFIELARSIWQVMYPYHFKAPIL